MSADTPSPRFTMVGSSDALACEGDACALPGGTIDIEPEADEAAAASVRAVNSALDEGASL